jgi:Ni2+-binding GTPase involved in maturation of urease and hydrogenase
MARKSNVETTEVPETETTEAEPVKVNGLDLASLTEADRKVLARLLGKALPSQGVVKISVRKQQGGDCLCGCGRQTKSEFAAGHDAQMKSLLKSLVEGTESTQINHKQFSKATAQKFLAERGW